MSTNSNQIVLDAFKENNAIKLGLNAVTTCSQLKENNVDFENIDTICQNIYALLNESSKNESDHPDVFTQFNQLGKDLIDAILPDTIQNDLRHYKDNNNIVLHLCLDEDLAYIPWELMNLDGECLCCTFNIGRKIRTVFETSSSQAENKKIPFSMLIVTNASDMLKQSKKECQVIRQIIDKKFSKTIRASSNSRISPDLLFSKIQQMNMVHFAGHSEYHPDQPERTGWKLFNGYFTSTDIIKLKKKKRVPSFIFSNSCQSGRFSDWRRFANAKQFFFGMAHEWMLAGVEHLIATLWEIRDSTGSQFSPYFYENLAANVPIGEALRKARIQLKEKHPDDLCWASYVLYGDPSYSYYADRRGTTDSVRSSKKVLTGKLDVQKIHFIVGLMLSMILVIMIGKEIIPFHLSFNKEKSPTEQIIDHTTIQQILDDKQRNLSEWIMKHRKSMDVRPDPFSSPLLTMIVEFDSPFSLLNANHEASIKSTIRKNIKEHTAFTCLEKDKLESLVFEASIGNDFSNFLAAQYFLFIAMETHKNRIDLTMRLVDQTRNDWDQWQVSIQQGFIAKQEAALCQQLIQSLKEIHASQLPLRAVVSKVENDGVIINIGELHGVRHGYKFQTLDKKIVFDISFLMKKQCYIVDNRLDASIHEGLRLVSVE